MSDYDDVPGKHGSFSADCAKIPHFEYLDARYDKFLERGTIGFRSYCATELLSEAREFAQPFRFQSPSRINRPQDEFAGPCTEPAFAQCLPLVKTLGESPLV